MGDLRERVSGIFGVIVGLTLFAGIIGAMTLTMEGSLLSRHSNDTMRASLSVASADVQSDRVRPTPESAASTVYVFECRRNGQRVFSDYFCGSDAHLRDVDLANMNTYSAPPVRNESLPSPAISSARSAPQRKGFSPASPLRDARRAQCEYLQRRKDQTDAQARQAHDSFESERLRAERHQIEDDYWELRCLKGR